MIKYRTLLIIILISTFRLLVAQNANYCYSLHLLGYPNEPQKESFFLIINSCNSIYSKEIYLNKLNPFFDYHFKKIHEKNKYIYFDPNRNYQIEGIKIYSIENLKYDDIKYLLRESHPEKLKNYSYTIANTYRDQGVFSESIAWMNASFEMRAIPPEETKSQLINLSGYILLLNTKGEVIYSNLSKQNTYWSLVLSSDSLLSCNYSGFNKENLMTGLQIVNIKNNKLIFDTQKPLKEKMEFLSWVEFNGYLVSARKKNGIFAEVYIFNLREKKMNIIGVNENYKFCDLSFDTQTNKLELIKDCGYEPAYIRKAEIDLKKMKVLQIIRYRN